MFCRLPQGRLRTGQLGLQVAVVELEQRIARLDVSPTWTKISVTTPATGVPTAMFSVLASMMPAAGDIRTQTAIAPARRPAVQPGRLLPAPPCRWRRPHPRRPGAGGNTCESCDLLTNCRPSPDARCSASSTVRQCRCALRYSSAGECAIFTIRPSSIRAMRSANSKMRASCVTMISARSVADARPRAAAPSPCGRSRGPARWSARRRRSASGRAPAPGRSRRAAAARRTAATAASCDAVAQADAAEHLLAPLSMRFARADAVDQQRHGDVLRGGQRRQQVERLEHEPDVSPR